MKNAVELAGFISAVELVSFVHRTVVEHAAPQSREARELALCGYILAAQIEEHTEHVARGLQRILAPEPGCDTRLLEVACNNAGAALGQLELGLRYAAIYLDRRATWLRREGLPPGVAASIRQLTSVDDRLRPILPVGQPGGARLCELLPTFDSAAPGAQLTIPPPQALLAIHEAAQGLCRVTRHFKPHLGARMDHDLTTARLKQLSIRARMALAVTCLGQEQRRLALQNPALDAIVTFLWSFVEVSLPYDWEVMRADQTELNSLIFAGDPVFGGPVAPALADLPSHIQSMCRDAVLIGTGELYGSPIDYSRGTYSDLLKVLAAVLAAGGSIPSLASFEISPYSEAGGWGAARFREDFDAGAVRRRLPRGYDEEV